MERLRGSLIRLVALLFVTAVVALAIVVATSSGMVGMPRSQPPAAARATPAPARVTPPSAHATSPTSERVTPTPPPADPASVPVTKAEVERRAADDSTRDLGMKVLEARVDEVSAELMSPDDAGRRVEVGWLPPSDPVWWVRVRGHFRYVGTRLFVAENTGLEATYTASERFLVYSSRTGEFLVQWIPGDEDSRMPPEKRAAGATMLAEETAIAQGLLPTHTPVPVPSTCPEEPGQGWPAIRLFSLGRTPPTGLRPTNYALVRAADGKLYTIFAGSKAEDPQQGIVLIAQGAPDPCAEPQGQAPRLQTTSLATPFRSGPVRVYRIEESNEVVLETPERLRVRLDFVARRFGAVEQGQIPPTPTPFAYPTGTTGGYRPIKGEPRSARVEQGKAYPFTLMTHCGVDHSVDFDGSFWDLVDPAFIRVDELDYFYAVGFNTTEGTMTLIDADHAVFAYERAEIRYRRHVGPKYIYPCA